MNDTAASRDHDAAFSGDPKNAHTRRFDAWVVPAALLVVLWLVLAFSYGGFLPRQWLPAALVASAFAFVAAAFAAFPRRPRRLSLVVLGLFFLYALWTALSAAWSASVDTAWTDAGRTFFYLIVLGLALTYLTDAGARRAMRYLLLGGAFVLLALVMWRLAASGWGPGDPMRMATRANAAFSDENRLMYPVSYPNNAAALFLILFWPLLWIAADSREWLPARVLSLATGAGLLSLAVLTQSRGGFWAFAITLVLLFVLSPSRLRLLLYVIVPLGLTIWAFPGLARYLDEGPATIGYGLAVRDTLYMMAAAGAACVGLALLERKIRLGRRTLQAIGAVVLLVLMVTSSYGIVRFDHDVGGMGTWFGDAWHRFTAEEEVHLPGGSVGRFTTVSTNGRWDIWRVAWRDYRNAPLLGVGAGNYVFTYDRLRRNLMKPQQPHSEELRALAETGTPGGILLFGSIGVGLGAMLWPRFSAGWSQIRRRRRDREQRRVLGTGGSRAAARSPHGDRDRGRWGSDPRAWAWSTALAVGVLYWWVHGAAEWFWQMPGVTLPMLLLLALGVAEADAFAAEAGADIGDPTPTDAPSPTPRWTLLWSSSVFRWLSSGVCLVVFAGLALPYLSMRFLDTSSQYLDSTIGAAAQTATAASLMPISAQPYSVRAEIYKEAARNALQRATSDDDTAALDYLALALVARDDAIARDPAPWALHYQAGLAALDLAQAKERVGTTPSAASAALLGPLANTPESPAALYLSMTPEELRILGRRHLEDAQDRNPLSTLVRDALDALG